MDARAWTEAGGAADQELVERVAATLELPRGPVAAAAIAQWRAGLAARGWTADDEDVADPVTATRHRYLLRHEESGCRVDALALPNDPADPQRLTVEDVADDGQARYTVSAVRLYGPEGSGLVADANLADARPDGAVTWVLSEAAAPSGEAAAEEAGMSATATADPFRHRFRLAGRPIPTAALAVALGLACAVALGGAAFLWRRRGAQAAV